MPTDRDRNVVFDPQVGFRPVADRGPDLTAPRRVFKRKQRRGLMLALKIALPAIAIVGVAYIVIWSRDALNNTRVNPLEVIDGAGKNGTDVTIAKVKYDGVDAHNRPFSITADSATQPQARQAGGDADLPKGDGGGDTSAAANASAPVNPGANPPAANVINLGHLVADITMADGAWVAVTADSGVYNRDTGIVDLSGNVNLFHDTGLSFETDAAIVDVHNDSARGDQPIEGQRPNGEIAAEGFEMRDDGRTVIFTGRAFLKLYPKAKQAPAAKPGAKPGAPAGAGSSSGENG